MQFVQTENLQDLFTLPLSPEAFTQLQALLNSLDQLVLTYQCDVWTYIWGNQIYLSAKAYKLLKGSANVHQAYNWLWKSSCQLKYKFFSWLLLKDRLSTCEILRRKNMFLPSYTCVLCSENIEESVLLARCMYRLAHGPLG